MFSVHPTVELGTLEGPKPCPGPSSRSWYLLAPRSLGQTAGQHPLTAPPALIGRPGDSKGHAHPSLMAQAKALGVCFPKGLSLAWLLPPRKRAPEEQPTAASANTYCNLSLICILATLIRRKYANVCKMKFIS